MISTAAEERIRRALPQAAQLAGANLTPRQIGILARAAAKAAQAPAERTRHSEPLRAQASPPDLRRGDAALLRLVAEGRSNTLVAIGLGITPDAVRRRMTRLMQALGVQSRVAAVARAYELGLLGGEQR